LSTPGNGDPFLLPQFGLSSWTRKRYKALLRHRVIPFDHQHNHFDLSTTQSFSNRARIILLLPNSFPSCHLSHTCNIGLISPHIQLIHPASCLHRKYKFTAETQRPTPDQLLVRHTQTPPRRTTRAAAKMAKQQASAKP